MPLVVTSWSPRAPRGHLMVTSWSPHGRLMVASWSPRGHLVVTSWSPRGHLMVTSWSPRAPRGRLVVASWSPRAPHGHLVVTSWSPHGLPECLSVVIYQRMRQRFDPYKLGDCASWLHIWRPPRPLSVFLGSALVPYGGTRGKSHVYIPTEISDPKIVPSTPRVHLQSTTVAAAGATTGKGPGSRTPSCGFGDRCVTITTNN